MRLPKLIDNSFALYCISAINSSLQSLLLRITSLRQPPTCRFTMQVPEYIERRIRRPIPPDSCVVDCSTPVVSFGDAHTATVATLGLNPSRVEFLDRNGNELIGPNRRLATLTSLGASDLTNAPLESVAEVLSDCNSYFERNPYRQWFDQLELILDACGVSYYNGSACHLDLVQWATDPTWGSLRPPALRNRLISADSRFLVEQLSNENIRLLLVNGMGVIRQLQSTAHASLDELKPIVGLSRQNTRIFMGMIVDRVRVIAWSTNLQSSFGVTTELRNEIARRAAELVD
ncbi:MAG: hypothetical protein SGJ20_14480 [Planctomycetota bacterium]|nr:hypothetical protein [Planctomycetota bacterium]